VHHELARTADDTSQRPAAARDLEL
jgi:hypothetical protein